MMTLCGAPNRCIEGYLLWVRRCSISVLIKHFVFTFGAIGERRRRTKWIRGWFQRLSGLLWSAAFLFFYFYFYMLYNFVRCFWWFCCRVRIICVCPMPITSTARRGPKRACSFYVRETFESKRNEMKTAQRCCIYDSQARARSVARLYRNDI